MNNTILNIIFFLLVTFLSNCCEAEDFKNLNSKKIQTQRFHHRLQKRENEMDQSIMKSTTETVVEMKSTTETVVDYPHMDEQEQEQFLGILKRHSRSSPPPSPESNEWFGKNDKWARKLDRLRRDAGPMDVQEEEDEWGGIFGEGRTVNTKGKTEKPSTKNKHQNQNEMNSEEIYREARRVIEASDERFRHHEAGHKSERHHGGGTRSKSRSRHHGQHADSRSRELSSHSKESGSDERGESHESDHHNERKH